MMENLYGELYDEEDEVGSGSQKFKSSRDAFEDRIERVKDFKFGFCAYILNRFFLCKSCCCLSKSCKEKYPCWKKSNLSYKKFKVAQERLQKEQDIQRIIDMNRISKLIHKVLFKTRQRRAIKYSRRFVIT